VTLEAIVFDFDGVIADSEPLHLRAFQAALGEEGLVLTPADYYANYLGFDDAGLFAKLAQDRGLAWSRARIAEMVARKGAKLQHFLNSGGVIFPGAADFIRTCAEAVPIAIASGALRHEIDEILGAAGLSELFTAIVAAGDTPESKPSPAPYQLAFERLRTGTGVPIQATRTVAIEDSRWGLASARGAGLRCVGVTTSYQPHELPGAELTVSGLAELTLEMLNALCAMPYAQGSR